MPSATEEEKKDPRTAEGGDTDAQEKATLALALPPLTLSPFSLTSSPIEGSGDRRHLLRHARAQRCTQGHPTRTGVLFAHSLASTNSLALVVLDAFSFSYLRNPVRPSFVVMLCVRVRVEGGKEGKRGSRSHRSPYTRTDTQNRRAHADMCLHIYTPEALLRKRNIKSLWKSERAGQEEGVVMAHTHTRTVTHTSVRVCAIIHDFGYPHGTRTEKHTHLSVSRAVPAFYQTTKVQEA